jgi:hypothetical protein
MLKKFISYLIIFSLLFVDSASCMRGGTKSEYDSDDKKPLLHKRRLSLTLPQKNDQPDLLEDPDIEAPPPAVPVSSPLLPEEGEASLPPQVIPEPLYPLLPKTKEKKLSSMDLLTLLKRERKMQRKFLR